MTRSDLHVRPVAWAIVLAAIIFGGGCYAHGGFGGYGYGAYGTYGYGGHRSYGAYGHYKGAGGYYGNIRSYAYSGIAPRYHYYRNGVAKRHYYGYRGGRYQKQGV
jgi:hypothetical protein